MKSATSFNGRRRLQTARIGTVLPLLLIALCFLPTPAAAGDCLKKASLIPIWSPQAQFAGYYVARDKGFYARHGIDLEILKGGPGHSPAQALKDGSADFAVLWLTTALQHRDAGLKLVNLGQIVRKSSLMLISKKTSDIRTIADMNGKKVGMWEGDLSIPPRTLFAQHGVRVREVPQSHTINLFLRGGIDVTSAMWYNEYHVILNTGLDPEELNVIFLQDQGVNFLEDGIYTLGKTLHRDPALAKALVAASLEGWRYAFAHPDEALDIVIRHMREAKLPANRTHQKWMLNRMRDLIMPDNDSGTPSLLDRQEYEAVGRAMRNEGLIRSYPDYEVFSGRADVRKK